MTVVDVIVIFVIFLSALFGVWRGLVKESISLAKWIFASWIAITFAPRLAQILPIESEAWSLGTAFAMFFICVFIIGTLVSHLVVQFVKKTGLSGADRVFGLLFGFLRGGLIIVIFVVVGQKVSLSNQPWWQNSQALTRFEDAAIVLSDYVPQGAAAIDTSGVVNSVDSDAIADQVLKQVNP